MYLSKRHISIASGFVLAGAVVVALVLLYLHLGNVNADLRQTQENLAQTKSELDLTNDTLTASQEAHAVLTAEHTALESERDTLEEVKAGLEGTKVVLEGELSRTRDELADTNDELAESVAQASELQANLSASREEVKSLSARAQELQLMYNTLDANHRTLTGDYQRLTAERASLQTRYDSLQSRYSTLQSQHSAFEAEFGTLEGLRSEIARLQRDMLALESEIAALERQRDPLILGQGDTRRNGFYCTGSMEPKITCLDEATWLTDFDPADITIGVTISYAPPCGGGTGSIAHRVIDVAIRNGVHYFWTKGDNSLTDEGDGCWVHEAKVTGYIIEIHKNVRMENAELRNRVNGARRALENALDNYLDRYDEYCGTLDENTCASVLSHGRRQEMSRLWNVASSAYDHYQCWVGVALDSQYAGHIPYRC